jgi:hypothetical protein
LDEKSRDCKQRIDTFFAAGKIEKKVIKFPSNLAVKIFTKDIMEFYI